MARVGIRARKSALRRRLVRGFGTMPPRQREIRKLNRDRKTWNKMLFLPAIQQAVMEAGRGYQVEARAVRAIQAAAEDHLVKYFTGLNGMARHAGRETITAEDSSTFKATMRLFSSLGPLLAEINRQRL